VIRPGVSAGEEVVEALTLVRRCYMPMAALGPAVPLWVSENGYATNLGRSEADQARNLDSTVRAVHRWSGTLGVTDYRWFNQRDNDSDGEDLFDAVGLLRDGYEEKPAYAAYRTLIDALGREASRPPSTAGPRRGRRRARVSPRTTALGARRLRTSGRLLRPAGVPASAGCRGRVTVTVQAGRRTVSRRRTALGSACRFATRIRLRGLGRHRRVRVLVRFAGNASLRPGGPSVQRIGLRRR